MEDRRRRQRRRALVVAALVEEGRRVGEERPVGGRIHDERRDRGREQLFPFLDHGLAARHGRFGGRGRRQGRAAER